MSEGKNCTKCLEWKSYEEFHKEKRMKDGHRNHCKACISTRKNRQYEENKETVLKRNKKWNEENKERYKQTQKQWRENNEKDIKKYQKQYKLENSEKNKKYQKNYRQTNADSIRKYLQSDQGKKAQRNKEAKRNKRTRSIGGDFTYEIRKEILERDKYICQHCGIEVHDLPWNKELFENYPYEMRLMKATADHIIPVEMGGKSTLENGQCLCMSCNASKSNRFIG